MTSGLNLRRAILFSCELLGIICWFSIAVLSCAGQVGETNRKTDGKEETQEDAIERLKPEELIYATVNGFAIGEGEVRFLLSNLKPASERQKNLLRRIAGPHGEKEISPEAIGLRQAAVEQWIERLLVLNYLREKQLAVSQAQVDAEYKIRETAMRERGEDLSKFVEELGLRPDSFKAHLAWELSWKSYVGEKITPDSLEKYFALKHRQFDGTQLRVAHIFKSFKKVSTIEEKKVILEEMERLKQQVESGAISFASAAKEHSEGTTAAGGGEIGWIDYIGPQSVPFNVAAFATPVGSVSEPVSTEIGAHLILILEEKKGTIPFSERIDLVRVAVVSDLWKWIVKQQKDQGSIVRNNRL